MDILPTFFTLPRAGLVLNFIGTVMVAFSFGKTIVDSYQEDEKGRKVQFAAFLHPTLFYWGIVLLCAGFILQLFS